jgi:hypothetical protein
MAMNHSGFIIAAAIVSLVTLSSPSFANADSGQRQHATRAAFRGNVAELRKDRAELHRDRAELGRDRTDLRELYRRGASRSDIANKRAEIRHGLGEIGQDRREIRGDVRELRRDNYKGRTNDRGYGYGRYENRGNRWGWGNNDNRGSRNRYDNRLDWRNHEAFNRWGRGHRFE